MQIYGGTSVAVPTMAGIVTLLNQYLVSTGALAQPGLANINPQLYRLGQNASGVFHDTTVGNNSLPCVAGSPDCVNGFFGYNAEPGYDRASGLGSPDAYSLVHAWVGQNASGALVTASIDQNPVFEQPGADPNGNRWQFTITLSDESGVAATVTAFRDQRAIVQRGHGVRDHEHCTERIDLIDGFGLQRHDTERRVDQCRFTYSGTDAQGHQWSGEITIPFTGPQVPLIVGGVSNAASGQQAYAPGMLASVYGTAMGDAVQTAGTIPLPQYLQGFEAEVGSVTAPLYYVSPDQVNLQIPYETPLGYTDADGGQPVYQREREHPSGGGGAGDICGKRVHFSAVQYCGAGQGNRPVYYGRGQAVSERGDRRLADDIDECTEAHSSCDSDGGEPERDDQLCRHHARAGWSGASELHRPCGRARGCAAGGGDGGDRGESAGEFDGDAIEAGS